MAPCHCAGEQAMKMLKQKYGEDYVTNGVGKVFRIAAEGLLGAEAIGQ